MTPKIVADESVDFRIVTELRKFGLSVLSVIEENPSIKDTEVLEIAVRNEAILITEDKDFGELVFRLKLPHKGVLLIRIINENVKTSTVAEAILKHFAELQGKFSVIDEKKIRIRE